MNHSDWFRLVTPIIHFKLFKRAIRLIISTSLVRLVMCETELFESLNPFGLKKYQCSNRIVNLLIQIGALILIQNRTFLCFLKCIYLIQIIANHFALDQKSRSEMLVSWIIVQIGTTEHGAWIVDHLVQVRKSFVLDLDFSVSTQVFWFRSGLRSVDLFFKLFYFYFLNRTKHQTIKAVQ